MTHHEVISNIGQQVQYTNGDVNRVGVIVGATDNYARVRFARREPEQLCSADDLALIAQPAPAY